jgi:four helix bundle protein
MTKLELVQRTKSFALRVVRLAEALPKGMSGQVMGRQVLRSACSVAANYRAALRGKSRADFATKINIVLEEADESLFWLEMIQEAGLLNDKKCQDLRQEAEELVRIFNATLQAARRKNHQS